MATLTPSSLSPDLSFNWVFLIELITCGVVTLFFLFYFNRVFAAIVSFGLRAWTWHKYRVYIDIQSLQISILGGRIFFKGVKYHGNNETVLIHEGYVTWKYWLANVQELDLTQHKELDTRDTSTDSSIDDKSGPNVHESEIHDILQVERGGTKKTPSFPCRLNVRVRGLEWFIYNRSPAYDDILAKLVGIDHEEPANDSGEELSEKTENDGLKRRHHKLQKSRQSDDHHERDIIGQPGSDSSIGEKPATSSSDEQTIPKFGTNRDTSSHDVNVVHSISAENDSNLLLQFLPINLELSKAAVVMGNENTRSVLTVKIDKGKGNIGATGCAPPDLYRQVIEFDLEHPVIQMKPNDDYKEDQAVAGARLKTGKMQISQAKQPTHRKSILHRYRRKFVHRLARLSPAFSRSVESFGSDSTGMNEAELATSQKWQGLSRYLEDFERDDKARWSSIEYAVVTTIVDCPGARISYYWDIPGKVLQRTAGSDTEDNAAPGFGIDIYLRGCIINYGPWADRQRAEIQRIFFPGLCMDSKPGAKPRTGDIRAPLKFKVYVELEHEAILRIPIREESKNWKWKKDPDMMAQGSNKNSKSHRIGRKKKNDKGSSGPEIRPFGWIDVKVSTNSTVKYAMDMVAQSDGFKNNLHVDIPNTEITTSVNHGILWRSVDLSLSCDLSNPLKWNALHTWSFDIVSNGLELFVLREHIFLIQDLVEDFTTGPPADYLTFTPFKYLLNLTFGDFRLYLNTNDSNIINNPSDFDDNTYLIIFGTHMLVHVCIPNERFRPYRNDITFDVGASTGGLNLHVPPWNTQATLLTHTELARLNDLRLSGKYQLCSTTSPSNTDTLLLDVFAKDLEVEIYGFLIRYFLVLKENYFGEHVHFKTLDEYQQMLNTDDSLLNDPARSQPQKTSNDLDVILTINSSSNCLIIPANLYSAKNNVRVELSALSLDLRFTNYYMDMMLDLCPLIFSTGHDRSGATTPSNGASGPQLFVDGAKVYGHRLFGLPHTEPTYVCNWDFSVGAVRGETSTEFLSRLLGGIKALAFSIDDDENAVPGVAITPIHDATFLRASIQPIRIWLHVDDAVLLLSTEELNVNFNDWAGISYSKKLNITIPDLSLACVDAKSASRHRGTSQPPVETHAFIQTAIQVDMVDRSIDFDQERRLQQLHLRREDCRTSRTQFLLHPNVLDNLPYDVPTHLHPPATPVPPMPLPLEQTGSTKLADDRSLTGSSFQSWRQNRTPIRRQSSFLSTTDTSSGRSDTHQSARVLKQQTRKGLGGGLADATTHAPARPPLQHVPTSTGHSSSFRSTQTSATPQGLPPTSVAFSSSYLPPYFPLESVYPDMKDVPELNLKSDSINVVDADRLISDGINSDKFETRSTYTSFIVDMYSGIRAYCNPRAIATILSLTTSMQAAYPEDILDVLQRDSIHDISNEEKKHIETGSNLDLKFVVPVTHVRFVSLDATSTNQNGSEVDQYDLVLDNIDVTLRNNSAPREKYDHLLERKGTVVLHAKLQSARLSATERIENTINPQAAVNLNVDDTIFWMIQDSQKLTADLKIRAVEMATKSPKIEYLASLVSRTTSLAQQFANDFEQCITSQRNRLQLFVYLISSTGSAAADPMFLTRPSYVLRAVDNHLRSNDSWKVVSRLRYMYHSLSNESRDNITMRTLGNNENCPVDVKEQVLRGLDEWRSWDLRDLTNCVVAKNVFGVKSEDTTVNGMPEEKNIRLAIAVAGVMLILDPGPKQNEVSFTTLGLSTEITPPSISSSYTMMSTMSSTEDSHVTSPHLTTVQVYCSESSITLNWEVLALAENVMALYAKHSNIEMPVDVSVQSTPLQPKQDTARRQLHVILDIEKGILAIETVNTKLISMSKAFKGALLTTQDSISGAELVSIVSSCEAATSKLRSRSVELSLCQIRYPSICVSFETNWVDRIEHNAWKVSGNSQELTFTVAQHSLVLLGIIDALIVDEVSQLVALGSRLPKTSADKLKPLPDTKLVKVVTINVALFLDMYAISIPIVESLAYNISGVIARASLATQLGSDITFDFDIKENLHDIRTRSLGRSHSIAIIQMPSTNGRLRSHESHSRRLVSVLATIEQIELDAASIRNIFGALNRPEIASLLAEAGDAVKLVQGHVNEVFGGQSGLAASSSISSEKSSTTSHAMIYEVHIAFAGFGVSAETSKNEGNTTRMSFNIGSVQVDVTNRSSQNDLVLLFPDISVNLGAVSFDLARFSTFGVDPCGNFKFAASLVASTKTSSHGHDVRSYHVQSGGLEINIFAETASTIIDVIGLLQDRIKDLDLSRERQYLQRLRKPAPKITVNDGEDDATLADDVSVALFGAIWSLELLHIQVSWIVGNDGDSPTREKEDLVLSFQRIDLSTRKQNSARLTIENLQLQMVSTTSNKKLRSQNSALLPEVIFNVGHVSGLDSRRLAFQAAGKSLDLQLTSQFIVPLIGIKKSIESATNNVRRATASWSTSDSDAPSNLRKVEVKKKPFFGKKRMGSLLVDADFAGAIVHLSNKKAIPHKPGHISRPSQGGRYGQFVQEDTANNTVLRAPGVAWKIEFKDNGIDDSSLDGEIKVSASTNILHPTVVPLILEISETIKDVVSSGDGETNKKQSDYKPTLPKAISAQEENILAADPSAVLGKTQLNLGLRICKQEFSLSCQPIARVAAIARFDDIYITLNTVKSKDYGHFFSISLAGRRLQASVQHVYSRESTGSFEVESVTLSLMNSKHVSGTSGLSAILNVSPTKVWINAKQLQDFLLFREIWVPPELRTRNDVPHSQPESNQPSTILVQRYQQVAATGAFPWNATVHVTELDVQLDLGQAIGKSTFMINKFWISSKKSSDWEQNLCLGFEKMGVDSVGRTSGFLHVQDFKIRSSIQWKDREMAINQTPLVQASIALKKFRAKAAFDYQPFLVADVTSFDFLMYNVRDGTRKGDRLVAVLNGDAVQVFCTTNTASQALAVYQALQRLVQEKRANYDTALREIEKFMKRKSVVTPGTLNSTPANNEQTDDKTDHSPVSLHTDVVVTLKAVNMGVFPSTFYDQQVFKLEALDAQARFAVAVDTKIRIHSSLGLTLGQLRIGLASVRRASFSQLSADVSVEEVVESATGSRGGTILKVPKVEAKMECWQEAGSNKIDYIFKSAFSGKVEVGWNYSRISYIRGMYGNHTRSLAQRLGKPLPESAVKITGVPNSTSIIGGDVDLDHTLSDESSTSLSDVVQGKQQKITAEVTVPVSKYEYHALEPPIIETPQLRDMGEATPPLEWIGLHRERLPTLTHQIVIVALCEVASEVEQAYGKILGNS